MSLPTLVIAGAQKCGTSTLYGLLRDHPQVFMSRPKELHFFDRNWRRGLDWYSSHFTPAPEHAHAGEATPTYTYDPTARQRMMETLPAASIVVALRNPADRAYSHYWHSRRLRVDPATTFEEALDLESVRLSSGQRRARVRFSYVDRGHYIDQLLELEKVYGPDQLHVVLLEDLVSDRSACLERLFASLAISTEPASSMQPRWKNRYRVKDSPEEAARSAEYPPMSAETRQQLVDHFRPYNDRLSTWLGRDLSDWNRF